MLCSYTSPRYQVSVYRTIGPLVIISMQEDHWQIHHDCFGLRILDIEHSRQDNLFSIISWNPV